MRINKTKNTLNNVLFGSINKIIAILFPFAIRTIIINVLGIQHVGLNSLFSSILNILSLAELGFGTAMVYSMYKPIAEDDTDTINALLNLYKKIYRIIGLVVLTAGL
ncbi:MAG: polysaccharide biosynthesis protein, partial [Clostridia bacterium]|nr:polysaccharide biosynthesis protein [Clostridia bacterium]